MSTFFSRRDFLACCSATAGLFCGVHSLFAETPQNRPFRFSICDWDLKAMGDPKAFEIAKSFGFDGIEVSYQSDGQFSLAKKENRPKFQKAAEESGLAISSLAMGCLNGTPLATEPETEQWVETCIEAMTDLDVQNVLVAFFGKGDMKDKPDAQKSVAEKMKRLGPIAEKSGRTLGIESYLSAKEHLDILAAIGSPSVKIYYDVRNVLTKEYPLYEDIELLLKEKAVCQIHLKEYDARLGSGIIDFNKIRALLDKYDYRGWLVIESSVKGDWQESQRENAAFVRKTFG
ncbi:MAG: sugar phosphate isomerase/epimerase family protein [Thermoguttaceae bacterium]